MLLNKVMKYIFGTSSISAPCDCVDQLAPIPITMVMSCLSQSLRPYNEITSKHNKIILFSVFFFLSRGTYNQVQSPTRQPISACIASTVCVGSYLKTTIKVRALSDCSIRVSQLYSILYRLSYNLLVHTLPLTQNISVIYYCS